MKAIISNIKENIFKDYNGYPSLFRLTYEALYKGYMYIWMYIWEYLHIDISLDR